MAVPSPDGAPGDFPLFRRARVRYHRSMPLLDLSSGDPIADKRFALARSYEEAGDFAVAADLYEQALEIVPAWVAAWYALGTARLQAGERDRAREAYLRSLELDGDDLFGARLKLALIEAKSPPAPPRAYVTGLFDQYAEKFDHVLVDKLHYRAPGLIAAALDEAGVGTVATALDLGCGTGLMAAALGARAAAIDGVDLSAAMVAEARAKGLYRRLAVDDIVAHCNRLPASGQELVVAADVLCYLGDLDPVMTAVARILAPGGAFAFSVEALDPDSEDDSLGYALRGSMRYAHDLGALIELGGAHGLAQATVRLDWLRLDRGEPVLGLVMVFRREA